MKPRRHSPFLLAAMALAGFTVITPCLHAVDGTWDGGGTSGIWGGFNNWSPNGVIANGVGATATFATAFGNGRTILLNTDRTLGQVVYTDPGAVTEMTIAWHSNNPTRVLTLNAGTGKPAINVTQADRALTVNARLGGTMGLDKIGPGTLVLGPPGSEPNHTFSGPTAITAGTLVLSDGLALSNSVLDTANSVVGDATNGLGTGVPAITLGGLAGDQNLADVFTTSGGYDTVTALTLNPGTGVSASYSGVIADGAAGMTLTKTGGGTQLFSGTNAYTGATAVDAGTLIFSTAGSAATVITVAGGATIGVLVASDNGQWVNAGDLTQANNSAVAINFGSTVPSTTVAPMKVDNLSLGTDIAVRVSADMVAGLAASQSYPLMTWTTNGPADATAFTLTLPHRIAGNLSVTGNTLFLNVTANASGPLSWNTGDGTWDTGTANWLDAVAAATTYMDPLDAVVFGDASGVSGNPAVTLNTTLSPVSVTMSSTSHDYSITGTGAISGTTSLTLDAANTRTLGVATFSNNYSGNTIIDGGTLQLLDFQVIPDGAGKGDVTVNGTLDLNTFAETINGLSGSGIVDTVAGGAPVLTVGGNNATSTFSGVIRNTAGSLALAKTGSGTLTLSGANTYSGTTTIAGGTLQVGAGGTSGALGSGAISNSGTLAFNRSDDIDLANAISGTGALAQSGTGILTLSGSVSYAGATTVIAGTLKLGAADLIPDGVGNGNVTVNGTLDLNSFSETINGLSGTGTVDTLAGGTPTLTVGGNNASSTFDGVIQDTAGTLSLAKIGTGTFTLGGANTLSGTVAVTAGTLAFTNTAPLDNCSGITLAGGTLLRPDVVDGVISAPITLGDSGTTATINAPSILGAGAGIPVPFTLNGAISGDGNVTFNGTQPNNGYGTIILKAAGTYAGTTLVTCSGSTNTQIFVNLGIGNALPVTTVLTLDGGNGTGSGRFARLNLQGFNQTLAGLTNVTRASRTQQVFNTSATACTLTVNNTADHTYSGQLGNATASNGNFGLAKAGTGVLTLTGTLGYTGDTTVSGGTLSLGNSNGNNDASAVTLAASGAKLLLNYAGTDIVGKLVIGSTEQALGTYGHTDSGATNGGLGVGAMDPYFEPGTGTLTVGSPYVLWAATNAPTGTPADDFDGDGVANGVEYVLGGTKDTNDLGKLPKPSTTGGNLAFTFERDQQSIDGSTTVVIEAGTNLSAWPDNYPVPDTAAAANPGVTVVKDSPTGFDTVTLTLSQAADPTKFARLKVTVTP